VLAGRYEPLRKLGEGAGGVVHLARDVRGGGPVALKVLRPEAGPRALEALRAEFAALASLDHPNVVKVFDYGMCGDPPGPYFTSEFVEGPDLAAYAAAGVPLEALVEAACQVARGLAHVHGRGLLHLDVKPGNIRVTEACDPQEPGRVRPRAILVDFGLARGPAHGCPHVAALGRPSGAGAGSAAGSLLYAAPEVLLGEAPDLRADLYSLGATLYRVLTGRPPFPGETALEVLRGQLERRPAPPRGLRPEVPPPLEGALLRLLAREPADRFASGEAAAQALAAAIGRPFAAEVAPETARACLRPRFVGRDGEARRLREAFDRATAEEPPPPRLYEARALDRRGSPGAALAPAPLGLPPIALGGSERRASGVADRRAPPAGGFPAPPPPAHVALVVGPAGSGKSRLLRDLEVHAQIHGAAVVAARGGCDERPFGAVREILGVLAGPLERDRELAAERVALIRAFAPRRDEAAETTETTEGTPGASRPPGEQRLGGHASASLVSGAQSSGVSSAQSAGALTARVADLLLEAARRRPLLLLLDDVELASEETLDLLAELERGLRALPLARPGAYERPAPRLLIALAVRDPAEVPGAPPDPVRAPAAALASLLADLRAGRRTIEVLARPLAPDDLAELAHSMLGVAGIPAPLAARLAAETGGLPLAVEEAVRTLVEDGRLVRRGGGHWLAAEDRPLFRGLAARLETRSPKAQALARALAALGGEAPAAVAFAAAELDPAAGAHAAAELERAQLAGHAKGRLHFLSRAAAEATMDAAPDRHAVERAALRALEQADPPPPARLLRLAARAPDPAPAARIALAAADEARAAPASARARRFLAIALERISAGLLSAPKGGAARRALAALQKRALRDLGQEALAAGLGAEAADAFARLAEAARRRGDPAAEAEALSRLGRAHVLSGDLDGAAAALASAVEAAERAGEAEVLALALREQGDLHLRRGEADTALLCFERSLDAVGAGAAGAETARYLRAIGRALFGKGAYAEARTYAERALALEERAAGPEAGAAAAGGALTETLELLADASFFLGDHARAIAARDRAVAIAREAYDRTSVASGLYGLALVYDSRGDLGGALDHYREALTVWRRLGDRRGLLRALSGVGRAALLRGAIGEAIEAWNEAATLARELGDDRAHGAALAHLALAYQRLGEAARAAACARQAARAGRLAGDAALEAEGLRGEAEARVLRGDLLEALDLFDRALALEPDAEGRALVLIGRGRTLVRRGELDAARATLDAAREAARAGVEAASAPGADWSGATHGEAPFARRVRPRVRAGALVAAVADARALVEALSGDPGRARASIDPTAPLLLPLRDAEAERAEALLALDPIAALGLLAAPPRDLEDPLRALLEGEAHLAFAALESSKGPGLLVRTPALERARERLEAARARALELDLPAISRRASFSLSTVAFGLGDLRTARERLAEAGPEDAEEDRLLRAAVDVREALVRAGSDEAPGTGAPPAPTLGLPVLEAEVELAVCRRERVAGARALAAAALARATALLARAAGGERGQPTAPVALLGAVARMEASALEEALSAEGAPIPGPEASAAIDALDARARARARVEVEREPDSPEPPARHPSLVDLLRLARDLAPGEDPRARLEALAGAALSAGSARRVALLSAEEGAIAVAARAGAAFDEAALAVARAAANEGKPPPGARLVPIRAAGRPLGALYLDGVPALAADAPLADALPAVADLAAIALSIARLADGERRAREEAARAGERLREAEARLVSEEDARRQKLDEIRRAVEESRRELALKYNYSNMVGQSPAMRAIFKLLDRITDSPVPVLILGESGTGKELVAKAVHFNGPRRDRPFLSVNCAALPEPLLEAELFGYVRGAFTGADRDKVGLFEAAHRGTLFLDEVEEMSPGMQAKLLRVLQEGEVRPVGAKAVRRVDVRVLSASNADLAKLVERGTFRTDLFYRLNTITVTLPALRDRKEDIPLLVQHFLEKIDGGAGKSLEPQALEALVHYHWPGNVRELENEMRRALTLAAGPRIAATDLSSHIKKGNVERYDIGHPEGLTLKERMEILERRILRDALARCSGNKTKCAKELGLSRFGFLKKLDKYGLR